MIKVLLCGCSGKMGGSVISLANESEDIKIVAGVDTVIKSFAFPVFSDFSGISVPVDVVLDFSNSSAVYGVLDFARKKNIPAIIATTGHSEQQIADIKAAAKDIPIFFTANMSLGINVLCALAKQAANILGGDFDIEIVEKHHNRKLDAPSGTALMLANELNSVFEDTYSYEYDRHSKRRMRPKNEIGIHSVRGGTIVGEHEVIFAGHEEVITLSHSAQSKGVFAAGALAAVRFIVNAEPGLYDMNDIISKQ
ncbi:MAG: 4-hydroxy-tetrahydrodipicolinate reductase [Clostridia bacterium]|nr:4-hydroxy-tetrahydrodipicolinate reductase [Clostridia bacterium]